MIRRQPGKCARYLAILKLEMSNRKSPVQPVAALLIAAAALLRLVPHPPNFAPVGGLALFGGARLKGWQAYLVPLLAMLITDPILSHLQGYSAYSRATPVIYGCFLLYVALGRILIGSSTNGLRIASVAALGSLQFFLFTNLFEWWAGGSMYPHNAAGLALCYTAALPFFGRTLVADLFYCAVLFSAHMLVSRRVEESNSRIATL